MSFRRRRDRYTVSTCCLKIHGSGGLITVSLKLAVGLTPKPVRRAMHSSPDMRQMIAELNTGYKPNLIVLDGVATFTDGGPSRGELKVGNVMIAGDDRVADGCSGHGHAQAARCEPGDHGPWCVRAGADRARLWET
jgi:uncharacterized protein (DUF362 family)